MAAAVLLAGSCLMMLSAPALHRRAWAPQPLAAVADSRYRKSRGLYERLEEGRDSNEAPPAAPITRPVLLAPAGGWPQVEAAIKGGADAIYFGCAAGLNARARATNFGEEELPALMARLHEAGLEGYMCVNVLIYEKEMAQAEQLARTAEAAGVDGLIVQDVGLASRLHAVAPSLPLHASTQVRITVRVRVRVWVWVWVRVRIRVRVRVSGAIAPAARLDADVHLRCGWRALRRARPRRAHRRADARARDRRHRGGHRGGARHQH